MVAPPLSLGAVQLRVMRLWSGVAVSEGAPGTVEGVAESAGGIAYWRLWSLTARISKVVARCRW